jgi:UDP-glucose 4-epimerase
MRVLVTGSHGFIGSQLVLALKERGDEVAEWDFPKTGYGDVYRSGSWWAIDPYFDEIYHLACVNQEEALGQPRLNMDVNALGTKFMAGMAANSGARFVYTSTASVYGNPTAIPTAVVGQRSRIWRAEQPKSDYAVAKLAGEHFVRNSGAKYTIFRLSNVYGPGQTTDNPYCGVVAKFFEAAMRSEPLQIIGDGSQTRDFTYVEDILPHLMNPELKGVLNCSHGVETPVYQLAMYMAPVTQQDIDVKFIQERPVDGIQRRCLISDVTCPTDLQTGLQRTYDWLRDPPLADSSSFDYSGRETII